MSAGSLQQKRFLEAFESYADDLFRHACFRISDRERAVDLVQDAYCKTWDYVTSGGSVHDFRPFLYRTLNNLIVDEYRKKKTTSLDALLEDEAVHEGMFEDLKTGSLAELEEQLDARSFLSQLEAMPVHYREVVTMRYLDELSPKEIAKILRTNENVVSVRIHRGMQWLKKNGKY